MRIRRGTQKKDVLLDTDLLQLLCVKNKLRRSYRVPPAQRSWTWSALTGPWWGLALGVEELQGTESEGCKWVHSDGTNRQGLCKTSVLQMNSVSFPFMCYLTTINLWNVWNSGETFSKSQKNVQTGQSHLNDKKTFILQMTNQL